jgi:hypothetical protein
MTISNYAMHELLQEEKGRARRAREEQRNDVHEEVHPTGPGAPVAEGLQTPAPLGACSAHPTIEGEQDHVEENEA